MNTVLAYERWLSERGVSLERLGLREVALHRADAMEAVDLLEREARTILGGDVYYVRGNTIEGACCNWHSDRQEREGRAAYVARSCKETREYIARFPNFPGCMPVFVLVAP